MGVSSSCSQCSFPLLNGHNADWHRNRSTTPSYLYVYPLKRKTSILGISTSLVESSVRGMTERFRAGPCNTSEGPPRVPIRFLKILNNALGLRSHSSVGSISWKSDTLEEKIVLRSSSLYSGDLPPLGWLEAPPTRYTSAVCLFHGNMQGTFDMCST